MFPTHFFSKDLTPELGGQPDEKLSQGVILTEDIMTVTNTSHLYFCLNL